MSSTLNNKTAPNLAGISLLQKRMAAGGRAAQAITTESKHLHRVKIIEVHEVDEEIAMSQRISEKMVPKSSIRIKSASRNRTSLQAGVRKRPNSAKRVSIKTGRDSLPGTPG